MKERRSREDYDLEPQAEQEEGMKKYSESKKAGSRGWRMKRGKSSRGKIIPWTPKIIMARDDSVNLSVRRVLFLMFVRSEKINIATANKYNLVLLMKFY